MPELPEVQTVRQTLQTFITHKTVKQVTINTPSVISGHPSPSNLLNNQLITNIERHGKQLAILTSQKALAVHLGMTGIIRYLANSKTLPPDKHIHVLWQFTDNSAMYFRDPRRFGGLWTFRDFPSLKQSRWTKLGPDALTIKPAQLHQRLSKTTRPIKSALLDQHLIAGLGNIYTDELLFSCQINPHTPANKTTTKQSQTLVRKMRIILNKAITAGGSSIRDYTNSNGQSGWFQIHHNVYGRAGEKCRKCQTILEHTRLGGRTTVWCGKCQPTV